MTGILSVDTIENNAGDFSIPTSYLQYRLVQRTTRFFFNNALWNPGNAYYEIPGSWISITPMHSNSVIKYSWMCCMSQFGRSAHSITHLKFYCNGQEIMRHSRGGTHQEHGNIVKWNLDSQGAGKSMRMGFVARQYNNSRNTHVAHFNGRRYIDGSDSSRNVPIYVSVEEVIYPS